MIGRAYRQVRISLGAVATVFENHDMRRLQLAWAAIALAMWAFAIALGVYAFEVGGATLVGVAALVRLLPGAIASPLAGTLGDRFPRRSVLIWSAIAAAVALTSTAVATAIEAPAGVVFILAGVFTVAISPYIPAEGALLPTIARSPQELSAANVAHSVMDNVGFLCGSILAGALLGLASTETAFVAAAVAAAVAVLLLAGLGCDERPSYETDDEISGLVAETALGARTILEHPRLRLVGLVLTLLVLFEGAADVLIVVLALDLLDLSEGSVGYLNAAWGIGALVGGVALAVLLERARLASGLLGGSLVAGASMALAGVWAVPVSAYIAWIGIGVGYTAVEVAGRTLMQRVGSDESLARALGFLETSRLLAMALGAIAAPALIAWLGIEGALIAVAAILPLISVINWGGLRRLEIGAPVDVRRFALLRGNSIFAPLPVDALEGVARGLVPVAAAGEQVVISQGEHGDRFYLIVEGEVEVRVDGSFRRREGPGESFGEIALLHDVRRTATVMAVRPTEMLALEREHFIAAVTGHRRSHEVARSEAHGRLHGPPGPGPPA